MKTYRSLIYKFISQLYRDYKVSIMPIMLDKWTKIKKISNLLYIFLVRDIKQ